MVFTFAKAMGKEVGKSLCEAEALGTAKDFVEKFKTSKAKVLWPGRRAGDRQIRRRKPHADRRSRSHPRRREGVDCGPKTLAQFKDVLSKAGTVVWNGPSAVFESRFRQGTRGLAEILANSGAITIVGARLGGGRCQFGLADKFTHISTGGGASLSNFSKGRKLAGHRDSGRCEIDRVVGSRQTSVPAMRGPKSIIACAIPLALTRRVSEGFACPSLTRRVSAA